MKVNLQQLQAQDNRRSILWFLLYDKDYQLSISILGQCFVAHGKSVSSKEITEQAQWLSEQKLIKTHHVNGIDYLKLTDKGQEVAKGIEQVLGVRPLRPSEDDEIKEFLGL